MTYSSADVCRLTGATYRQVDYWARTGRIAGQGAAAGPGSRRAWTDAQVAQVHRLVAASDARRHWDTPAVSS